MLWYMNNISVLQPICPFVNIWYDSCKTRTYSQWMQHWLRFTKLIPMFASDGANKGHLQWGLLFDRRFMQKSESTSRHSFLSVPNLQGRPWFPVPKTDMMTINMIATINSALTRAWNFYKCWGKGINMNNLTYKHIFYHTRTPQTNTYIM